MSESNDRLENLICLLRALPEDEIAAVQTFVEGLARRKVAVQEARAPYIVSTGTMGVMTCLDEREYQTMPRLVTRDELLDLLASGPPGFLPGELDSLLADIEHIREMELEAPCQPIY